MNSTRAPRARALQVLTTSGRKQSQSGSASIEQQVMMTNPGAQPHRAPTKLSLLSGRATYV
jgi:hypothetical protein